MAVDLLEQIDVFVQLVADADAEFALAADARAELVELGVLLGDDAAVMGVQLVV